MQFFTINIDILCESINASRDVLNENTHFKQENRVCVSYASKIKLARFASFFCSLANRYIEKYFLVIMGCASVCIFSSKITKQRFSTFYIRVINRQLVVTR